MLEYFLPLQVSTVFQLLNSMLRSPPEDLGRSIEVEVVMTRQGPLKTQASIATFLAAVQAQTLAFSIQDNSTRLKIAINAFAFTGVLLDVVAAFLALQASTLVESYIDCMDNLFRAVMRYTPAELAQVHASLQQTLSPSILAMDPVHVIFVKEVRAHLLRRIHIRMMKREEIEAGLREEGLGHDGTPPPADTQRLPRDTLEAGRLVYTLNIASDAASVSTRWGIICFLVSVICLAKDTQPPAVWIPAITVCSCATTLPVLKTVFRTVFRSHFS